MIANHHFWHITESTFGIIIVAMIGAIATWQGKRGRRVEAKVDKSLARTETGNGRQLGETVHDIAQLQEVLSAQLHTNTRELLIVSTKADKAATTAALAAAKATSVERKVQEGHDRIESKLDQHLHDSTGKYEEIITKLEEAG